MTDLIEVKTVNLSGEALNWAVAIAEGHKPFVQAAHYGIPDRVFLEVDRDPEDEGALIGKRYKPSTDWGCCGPLKTKHLIGDGPVHGGWVAHPSKPNEPTDWMEASEPLTAICRAVVVKISGWTVQVPKELIS